MTQIIRSNTKKSLGLAVRILKQGGTIIYPTETSYGLGCDGTNPRAVRKIFKIKKRNFRKNLTYIVPSVEIAEKYGIITKIDKKIIKKFMPGNITLVVKSRNKKFGKEFAFRISSNKFANNLALKFMKPIVATSANISGNESLYNIDEIKKIFLGKADLIIDSGNLKRRKPTIVLDLFDGVNIRREGAISEKEIRQILRDLNERA